MSLSSDIGQRRLSLADKLRGVQWGLVILIAAISGIGFAMLYSAANGSLQPWASRQMTRFAIAFVPMLLVAIIDIRHWFRAAYWVYGVALMLVIAVDLRGFVGMGAQRWIDLGFIQLQPSEIMIGKLAPYFLISVIDSTLCAAIAIWGIHIGVASLPCEMSLNARDCHARRML